MTDWKKLAQEYLNERDECLDLATRNRKVADRYREALERIKDNAYSMLLAQTNAGTPEDAPEAINARFNYTEANSALTGA